MSFRLLLRCDAARPDNDRKRMYVLDLCLSCAQSGMCALGCDVRCLRRFALTCPFSAEQNCEDVCFRYVVWRCSVVRALGGDVQFVRFAGRFALTCRPLLSKTNATPRSNNDRKRMCLFDLCFVGAQNGTCALGCDIQFLSFVRRSAPRPPRTLIKRNVAVPRVPRHRYKRSPSWCAAIYDTTWNGTSYTS